MTLEERIKYATQKRDEALSYSTTHDLVYWHGYLDALRAVRRDTQNESKN